MALYKFDYYYYHYYYNTEWQQVCNQQVLSDIGMPTVQCVKMKSSPVLDTFPVQQNAVYVLIVGLVSMGSDIRASFVALCPSALLSVSVNCCCCFFTRDSIHVYAIARICYRPSVCPSVTLVYHRKTAEVTIIKFSHTVAPFLLVFVG